MIEKQIIIDDIDVSGCAYIIPPHKQCPNKPMLYAKETSCFACKEHNTKLNFCKNNPNCYYKQLKRKEKEYLILATLIRNTKAYSDVCDECKDEILLYPSISGRTDYKQIEVEERALKNIINKLKE